MLPLLADAKIISQQFNQGAKKCTMVCYYRSHPDKLFDMHGKLQPSAIVETASQDTKAMVLVQAMNASSLTGQQMTTSLHALPRSSLASIFTRSF
jgi:hypothetical protein